MGSSLHSEFGVFISYSHDDRMTAGLFAREIEKIGYKPWIDFEGIVGGDEWKRSIERALDRSVALLALMTPEAVGSDWVSYEIDRAREKGCTIIPLMVRTCTLPASILPLHYIDCRGGLNEKTMRELQRALLYAVRRHSDALADETDPFVPIATPPPPQPPKEDDTQPAPRVKAQPPQAATGRPLALIIEDIESAQELIRDVLLEANLDVHIAATRNEATAYIRKHKYAFITLDMMLGPDDIHGQQGIDVLDLLRRYQSDVPVVMITSLKWEQAYVRDFFVEHRIVDLLGKPFKRDELRELVKKYVSKTRH